MGKAQRLKAERSAEAAGAYALADRDRVTGLRNRRGFEQMLTLAGWPKPPRWQSLH